MDEDKLTDSQGNECLNSLLKQEVSTNLQMPVFVVRARSNVVLPQEAAIQGSRQGHGPYLRRKFGLPRLDGSLQTDDSEVRDAALCPALCRAGARPRD